MTTYGLYKLYKLRKDVATRRSPWRKEEEMTTELLKAPFPYFGGKSRVAKIVWEHFGDVKNYVEPFAGSLAVLLGRPHPARIETVNDKDTYLANFWRALQHDPEGVARYADWPINEADLHARHLWLVQQAQFRERMMADPEYYDSRVAGWWVWGLSCWIGGGWCAVRERPARSRPTVNKLHGVHCLSHKLPAIGNGGKGVHRKTLRQGSGQAAGNLYEYMDALATRLRRVRVCCGDWQRVVSKAVTYGNGLTAVFLDPPYAASAGRDPYLYGVEDLQVSHRVRVWALENGDNPQLRIALCGYEQEHGPYMPSSWPCVAWKTGGGYGNQGQCSRGQANRHKERIWFSPHCLQESNGISHHDQGQIEYVASSAN